MSKKQYSLLAAGVLCALLLVGPQAVVRGAQQDQTANQASAADAAKALALAFSPKVGDTMHYKSTLKIAAGGNEIVVEQNRKHVVKEIKDNKDFVLLIEDEGGKLTMGGNDSPLPAGAPTTITLNKVDTILSFKPERDDNPYLSATTQHLMALIDRIIFPDKTVKPGDSWTTEVDNPQVKDKKVTIKTTFVGEDKADGAAVWKIKQTVEADTEIAGNKMTAETTALLDPATGQLIEAQQSVKGLPGSMGPVDWTGSVKRTQPDVGKEEKKEKPAR